MNIFRSFAAGVAALGLSATAALAADWQPRKPVEFIIMAGTGGGADQIARLLQGLGHDHGNRFANEPHAALGQHRAFRRSTPATEGLA